MTVFFPPKYPTYQTTQMENVAFINTRMRAKQSVNPEEVAWYIALTGNRAAIEQFQIVKSRVEYLIEGGWTLQTNYACLEDLHPETIERINSNPLNFKCLEFFVDREKRYFFLEHGC